MPTPDAASVNTVILAVLGIGGSVFVMRYIRPILDTQEKHRIRLTSDVAALTEKVSAAEKERTLLREMVTQRAQVDDLAQRFKISSDAAEAAHRALLAEILRHDHAAAEAHQKQLLVLNEMVYTLRGMRGQRGETGEKGDHGQDAPR